MSQAVIHGLYNHFKGGAYVVIGEAKHSETGENLILYKEMLPFLRGEKAVVWPRPEKMFFEDIFKDGLQIPRFRYVGPVDDDPTGLDGTNRYSR